MMNSGPKPEVRGPKSDVRGPGPFRPRRGQGAHHPGPQPSRLGRVAPRGDARDLTPMADVARFEAEVLPQLDTLYRVARRLTGERADAADLVQEALLKP